MSSVKAFWLSWAAATVAGAGAFILAKRQIHADRTARRKERLLQEQRQADAANNDPAGSPSQEAGSDPAPTRHAPAGDSGRSRYESDRPYRSQKGDRFS